MEHRPVVHKDCEILNCYICDGGLYECEICGGAEGGLPTDCPGRRMTGDEMGAVYAGALDFVGGVWIKKVGGE